MQIKKILSLVIVLTLIFSLSACGGAAETVSDPSKTEDPLVQDSQTTSIENSSTESVTIKIGVVGEDIAMWPPVIEKLAQQGVKIELVEFSEYVMPNLALNDGEIDLNAFQHRAYLSNEIAKKGYNIVEIGTTYIAPMNIYSNNITDVADLEKGAKVAIPDDATNQGRALKVLESAGLIKIDESVGFLGEIKDITENPLELELLAVDASQIYSLLPDVAIGIINNNFAINFGLKPEEDSIFIEKVATGGADNPYMNILVARSDEKDNEIFKKVLEAYQSPEVEEIFKTYYGGSYLITW